MSTISLRHCLICGVPHVPPEVAARVRAGENVDVEIVYGSGVAGNVLRWGTGALNIDACRVGSDVIETINTPGKDKFANMYGGNLIPRTGNTSHIGRWPANVIHDGSDEVLAAFPETGISSGGQASTATGFGEFGGGSRSIEKRDPGFGDSGSAARFFYTAKADADDRIGSKHPTVKPLDLIQYLIRLVTPPKGIVLDCFAGSGTTGEAAWREGFSAILIEREAEYVADIERRMKLALAGPDERAREAIKARTADKPRDAGPLFGGTSEPSQWGRREVYGHFADEGPKDQAWRNVKAAKGGAA